jgi:drug/metabolite transporter (DMT)-like permease
MFKKIDLKFFSSKLLFLRGLFGGFAVFLFYLSIVKVGIAKGTVISYTYPIFAALGGVIFLKEKVSVIQWLAFAAAIFGIFLVAHKSGTSFIESFGLYDMLAVAGAVCAGIAIVIVKKLRETDSSYSIFFVQCAIGFWLVIVPANLVPCEISLTGGVILLLIGLTAAGAQLLMTYAYGHIKVTAGSAISMLTPVINIIIGFVLFKEVITAKIAAGIIIILISCIIVITCKKNENTPEKEG